jgi:DNA-binding GntR family transcriptional regulator
MIRQQQLPVGTHLAAQRIADQIRVSRSPVNDALKLLCENGIVVRQENRGYFLAKDLSKDALSAKKIKQLAGEDVVTNAYFQLADDLLTGELSAECSEALIRSRYSLTAAQAQTLLRRIANEGWAHRKPGYGWEFSSMMTTPESLLQSYRLRLALEPAALLEPTYHIDPAVIRRCREAEYHLLNGGIDTDSADQLHERGVRFHESLVEASGNPYFIETIKRVNQVRRLLSYRSMRDRERYREHCEQHLAILALLEEGRNREASEALREHLQATLKNLGSISGLLGERPAGRKNMARGGRSVEV